MTGIDDQGAVAARAMLQPRMPIMHRHDRVIDDSCTCPRTDCGGVLVAPEVPRCPWHDDGEARDWAAVFHRADRCRAES